MNLIPVDPEEVVAQYHAYIAKQKHDLANVSQEARIKCYDSNIVWKLKQFAGDFPSVELTIDREITSGWIFKHTDVQFTLSGPRVDVRFCLERIETAIEKYMKRLLQ